MINLRLVNKSFQEENHRECLDIADSCGYLRSLFSFLKFHQFCLIVYQHRNHFSYTSHRRYSIHLAFPSVLFYESSSKAQIPHQKHQAITKWYAIYVVKGDNEWFQDPSEHVYHVSYATVSQLCLARDCWTNLQEFGYLLENPIWKKNLEKEGSFDEQFGIEKKRMIINFS